MMVHVFGKADSPCCANWALQRTAVDQNDSVSKNVIDAVLHKFYKDDYLDTFVSVNTFERWRIPLSKMDV